MGGAGAARTSAWWAVVPLALACASKQHLALLLPVLLVWRPFGCAPHARHRRPDRRRSCCRGSSPVRRDFVHDTITLLVTFHPIRFANTLYLLALNTFGVTLPFWVTGLVVLGTLAARRARVVRRRQPGLAELLRWLALVLLVANLVNKQAFYNQFWLVGALVAASLALPQGERPPSRRVATEPDTGVPEPRQAGPQPDRGGRRRERRSAGVAAPGEPPAVARPGCASTDARAASVAASASASEPVDAPAATSRRRAGLPVVVGDELHGLPRREVGHLDVAAGRLQVRRGRQPARAVPGADRPRPAARRRRAGDTSARA